MASEHSLDISAKIDLQAFKDAITQSEKEVIGRYDFKGVTYEIKYREKEKQLIAAGRVKRPTKLLIRLTLKRQKKFRLKSKILKRKLRLRLRGSTSVLNPNRSMNSKKLWLILKGWSGMLPLSLITFAKA